MIVRRSNLLVPLVDAPGFVDDGARPDAVTLCISSEPAGDARARAALAAAVGRFRAIGADVLLGVDSSSSGDLGAWLGAAELTGLVLTGAETEADVQRVAALVADAEHRGAQPPRFEIVLVLTSARAVLDVRRIVRAAPRVTQVGIDEAAYCRACEIEPTADVDPCEHVRGRLVVEAVAAHVQPIAGAPASADSHGPESGMDVASVVRRARDVGVKGMTCTDPSWIPVLNRGFAPDPAQLEFARRARAAFAEAVAGGMAATRLDGRMIDAPVATWADDVIRRAATCAARDGRPAGASPGG